MAAGKKTANKTRPTRVSAASFLAKVTPDARRQDALALAALMEKLSGEKPLMWGPSIVGFGSCHYKYDSGREGDMPWAFRPAIPRWCSISAPAFPAAKSYWRSWGR